MSSNYMPIGKLDLKVCVRECFNYLAFKLNNVFVLCQSYFLLISISI